MHYNPIYPGLCKNLLTMGEGAYGPLSKNALNFKVGGKTVRVSEGGLGLLSSPKFLFSSPE